MTGALIILLITVFVGLLLYVHDLRYRRRHPEEATEKTDAPAEEDHGELCCGKHLVCEKPLSPRPGEKPVYFDDEELDRFAGRDAEAYEPEEIDEIREVMMTLLPDDVAGWARSIQLRGIALPNELRDELFLLVRKD